MITGCCYISNVKLNLKHQQNSITIYDTIRLRHHIIAAVDMPTRPCVFRYPFTIFMWILWRGRSHRLTPNNSPLSALKCEYHFSVCCHVKPADEQQKATLNSLTSQTLSLLNAHKGWEASLCVAAISLQEFFQNANFESTFYIILCVRGDALVSITIESAVQREEQQ